MVSQSGEASTGEESNMKQTIISLIDDVDGGEADETVSFALDGVSYEVDLSSANGDLLRAALAKFITNGRRAAKGTVVSINRPAKQATVARADREQTRAMREWINQQVPGAVRDKGRIPVKMMDAFHANNPAMIPGFERTVSKAVLSLTEPANSRVVKGGEEVKPQAKPKRARARGGLAVVTKAS
jgi:hypothetical protein